MKLLLRFFAILLFLACPAASRAQWNVELKPAKSSQQTGYYVNKFTDRAQNTFFFNSNSLWSMGVHTAEGIFDYYDHEVYAFFLFFKNGVSVRHNSVRLRVPEGSADDAYFMDKDFAREVADFLKNEGSITISIDRYERSDFEIKVPMCRDLKY